MYYRWRGDAFLLPSPTYSRASMLVCNSLNSIYRANNVSVPRESANDVSVDDVSVDNMTSAFPGFGTMPK